MTTRFVCLALSFSCLVHQASPFMVPLLPANPNRDGCPSRNLLAGLSPRGRECRPGGTALWRRRSSRGEGLLAGNGGSEGIGQGRSTGKDDDGDDDDDDDDDDVGIRIARLKSEIQEAVEAEDYAAAAAMKEELLELKRGSVKRMFEQEGRASQQEGSKGGDEEGDDDDGEAAAVSAITPVKSGRGGMVSARKPKYCVLSANERLRDDEADDSIYYSTPRLTLHCDEMFATKLQGLYSERLAKGSRILDLGASCATLLPDDLNPSEVCGLGMNMKELRENQELTHRVVYDLNAAPELPFPDNSFDAVLLSSVFSYLTEPESILAEVSRVLSPAGVIIVSFSDRVWMSKATDAWKTRGNLARCQLVQDCMRAAGGLSEPELILDAPILSPVGQLIPQLRDQVGGDPFLAVVSYKGFPPVGWAMQISPQETINIPIVNKTVNALKVTPFAAMYLIYILLSSTLDF